MQDHRGRTHHLDAFAAAEAEMRTERTERLTDLDTITKEALDQRRRQDLEVFNVKRGENGETHVRDGHLEIDVAREVSDATGEPYESVASALAAKRSVPHPTGFGGALGAPQDDEGFLSQGAPTVGEGFRSGGFDRGRGAVGGRGFSPYVSPDLDEAAMADARERDDRARGGYAVHPSELSAYSEDEARFGDDPRNGAPPYDAVEGSARSGGARRARAAGSRRAKRSARREARGGFTDGYKIAAAGVAGFAAARFLYPAVTRGRDAGLAGCAATGAVCAAAAFYLLGPET